MKSRILLNIIASFSLLSVFSCSDNIEPQVTPVEKTPGASTYTLSIKASKGDLTKALVLNGSTLNATWDGTEKVYVFLNGNMESHVAILTPDKNAHPNPSACTLEGQFITLPKNGDLLTLKLNSDNYSGQDGTLKFIADHCDYAVATLHVTGVAGSQIMSTEGTASFVSHQAIVKFTLLDKSNNNAAISPSSLTVNYGTGRVSLTEIPAATYTTNGAGVLFVALPAIEGAPVSLYATIAEDSHRSYYKSSATFKEGKCYEISVKMSISNIVYNETQLLAAIAGGTPYIILGDDISMQSCVKIGESVAQTVTIDLAGHTLSRSLESAKANGHVIEVCSNGNLTINDSGTTSTGTKAGTTTSGTITGCTFSGSTATTRGGAIWSNSSLTVSNCTFDSNVALAAGEGGDGGALHLESGTATLTDVTITNNTSKDAGGIYVKSEATLNLGGTTGSTISGNTSSEHGGGGIVNYGTVNLSGTVNITENTCHTHGAGIWSNGTLLSMEGYISVKGNTGDDIYLKKGKVICTGTLTGEKESIGVDMESLAVFTSGYKAHNENTNHFFPSGTVNGMGLTEQGEGKMLYSYIDTSMDIYGEVVPKKCFVDINVDIIPNICSSTTYGSGGDLIDSQWFVASGEGSTAHGLTCGSGVRNLILCDGASITINEGLFVPKGSTLHMYCQSYGDKMGKLTADNSGEGTGAGIGCKDKADDDDNRTGTIIIHGGDIVAKGGRLAAGIGGGEDRPSGTITIWGGKVNATGGTDGAGIGGGKYDNKGGKSGHIEIWGGDIGAYGDKGNDCYGAGIGGGAFPPSITDDIDDNYDINIYGGNIVAIGGGWGSSDGYSTATPKGGAAGIGGGRYSRPGSIEIRGGTIYAKGTYSEEQSSAADQVQYHYYFDGRGIGSGGGGKVGTVKIWNGTITAVSYRGGKDSEGHEIKQGAFDKDGLTIDAALKVKGGDNEASATPANRIEICAYNKWVRIEP